MPSITVRRADAWQDKLRAYTILIDGREAGAIGNGSEERLEVAAGDHAIALRIDWMGSQEIGFTASESAEPVFAASPGMKTRWLALFGMLATMVMRRPYISLERVA